MLQPEEYEEFFTKLKNPINVQHIKKLLKGNQNWMKGNPSVHDQRKIRGDLAGSQDPKIIILTCADSRVSPEYIFDANIGDIFTIRVAGNVVSPVISASIEFSIAELNSTLICVLGHENCGAVTTKIKDTQSAFVSSNNLLAILKRIDVRTDDTLTENIIANIKKQSQAIKTSSYIVSSMFADKKIDIVGMHYSLETGEVNILDFLPR